MMPGMTIMRAKQRCNFVAFSVEAFMYMSAVLRRSCPA